MLRATPGDRAWGLTLAACAAGTPGSRWAPPRGPCLGLLLGAWGRRFARRAWEKGCRYEKARPRGSHQSCAAPAHVLPACCHPGGRSLPLGSPCPLPRAARPQPHAFPSWGLAGCRATTRQHRSKPRASTGAMPAKNPQQPQHPVHVPCHGLPWGANGEGLVCPMWRLLPSDKCLRQFLDQSL